MPQPGAGGFGEVQPYPDIHIYEKLAKENILVFTMANQEVSLGSQVIVTGLVLRFTYKGLCTTPSQLAPHINAHHHLCPYLVPAPYAVQYPCWHGEYPEFLRGHR